MDQPVNALEKFINDFELRHTDGVVFFKAVIHLLIKGNIQVQNSEVHIITSAGLATVYILDLDSNFFQLPEMFEAKKHTFTCIDNICLKIEGESGNGKFTISIFPNKK